MKEFFKDPCENLKNSYINVKKILSESKKMLYFKCKISWILYLNKVNFLINS